MLVLVQSIIGSSLELNVPYMWSLAKITKTFLSLSRTSLDAERSFSRCINILTLNKTNLNENLNKYVILYFSGHIETIFEQF